MYGLSHLSLSATCSKIYGTVIYFLASCLSSSFFFFLSSFLLKRPVQAIRSPHVICPIRLFLTKGLKFQSLFLGFLSSPLNPRSNSTAKTYRGEIFVEELCPHRLTQVAFDLQCTIQCILNYLLVVFKSHQTSRLHLWLYRFQTGRRGQIVIPIFT